MIIIDNFQKKGELRLDPNVSTFIEVKFSEFYLYIFCKCFRENSLKCFASFRPRLMKIGENPQHISVLLNIIPKYHIFKLLVTSSCNNHYLLAFISWSLCNPIVLKAFQTDGYCYNLIM